jgi:methylphosphotriester-DNA--protein-cysteine methyltransferase
MSITSTLVKRADIRFHEADPELRSYVGCFWVVTAERDAAIRVVPDGSTAVSIQLQNGQPSEWILRGPLVQPEERRFDSPALLIGVRLRPGVAFILSRIAAHTIVGRHVNLNGIVAFHELVSQQASARGSAECLDVLQRFLIARLTGTHVHDVVDRTLREIERQDGCLRVADVAARCGVSPRHLNRLMRIWVGYGPKSFARMVRFQKILKQMEQSPGQSAAVLASETGYFDQSHLTLDVGRLAGATPRHLASRCAADFYKTRCDDPA